MALEITHHVVQRSWFIGAMLEANGGRWPDLEELVHAIYSHHIRPGDTVLDIGVNQGFHLVRLARLVGPKGRVVGVEAVPAFAEQALRALAREAPGLAGRVTLHRCAVAAEQGVADFFVTSITDGGLSGLQLRPVIADHPFERIVVRKTTIDALLPPERIHFVKIDIEGGEYDALRGSPVLLSQKALMTFEFDRTAPINFEYEADDFLNLLHRAGYLVCDVFGFEVDSAAAMVNAEIWNFVAVPPDLDHIAVTAPARRVLETRFPPLRAFAPCPPPSPELVEAINRGGAW